MDDPRAAGVLLREHARDVGIDIYRPNKSSDSRGEAPQKMGVNLPGRYIAPEANDSAFVKEIGVLLADGRSADEEVICVLQVQWSTPLDQIVSLMDQGIRIYRLVPTGSFIVRLRLDQICPLRSQGFVRRIFRYEPRFKYREDEIPSNPVSVTVWSLDGNRPEFREDLQRLGARNIQFVEKIDFYSMQLSRTLAERLSEFWWVFKIFWNPPLQPLDDGCGAFRGSGGQDVRLFVAVG